MLDSIETVDVEPIKLDLYNHRYPVNATYWAVSSELADRLSWLQLVFALGAPKSSTPAEDRSTIEATFQAAMRVLRAYALVLSVPRPNIRTKASTYYHCLVVHEIWERAFGSDFEKAHSMLIELIAALPEDLGSDRADEHVERILELSRGLRDVLDCYARGVTRGTITTPNHRGCGF